MNPCPTEISLLKALIDRLVDITSAIAAKQTGRPVNDVKDSLDVLRMYQEQLHAAEAYGSQDGLLRAANGLTTVNKRLSDQVWPYEHDGVKPLAAQVTDAAIFAAACLWRSST